MSAQDDQTIPPDAVLLRVLKHPDWIINKDGKTRPSSAAFFEARGEVSHFIDAPGMINELFRLFPGWPIAAVPASVVRGRGLGIERSPGDCPKDFRGDPANHVIVGPPPNVGRPAYEKMARPIAKLPDVNIIFPTEQEPQP